MRLVRGAPGSGKTATVLREFRQALQAGESDLRIVVPTATLVRHLQHELARDGAVFSPHRIVSLSNLLEERAAPLKIVPEGLLRAIVRDLLRPARFPEFGEAATTEGMGAVVIATIEVFENAGCTPGKLAAVRKLTPHARAFEKIWRGATEAVRARGYATRGDLFRAAGANTTPLRIWMDGFVAFSQLELDLIGALAGFCDLTLTVTDSPAADAIRRFALRLGAEDRFLPGPARKPRTTVISARTVEREVDEIARRILDLREHGTPFRHMAVALRDAEAYVSLLRGTFERFGVPARFYFRSPLRSHPVAVFLGGLIAGALNGWDFEGTLQALRAHPRWGSSADFDRFDFAVREALPGHGAESLLALCEADWLRSEIAVCLQTGSWCDDRLLPAVWKSRLQTLAATLYRPGTLSVAASQADVETARSHTAGLRSWLTVLDSIADFWHGDGQTISLQEFWPVASCAVSAAVVQPADDRAEVVHVMSVYEARQWDVSALFVCGLTDRDFPQQHTRNLLFPDNEIDRLRAAGVPLRKASEQEQEEQWLFESLLSRSTGSLFLSCPEHDRAGKSVHPSRFLDQGHRAETALPCRPVPAVSHASRGLAGRVNSESLHEELARLHRTIGMTALEDLAQCRFKFFGRKTLSLKAAPELPGQRMNPRVAGTILHVALNRWLTERDRDFVEIFEIAFDETCRAQHIPAGYKLEVERIQSREIARRVSATDLWTADESSGEVELALDFPGGITINGRVDRIDRFGDRCVIIDYKSSKAANVEKLVTSTTRLQGPLYALAVREKLGLNPVAMIFWAVRDDKRYGWGSIPGTALAFEPMPAEWANDARIRTIERLSGFLSGQVHPHPEETESCRWCDFRTACRVEEPELVMIESARGA